VRISAAISRTCGPWFRLRAAVAGELDDGAVGDGVGEGDAQLDEVGAAALGGLRPARECGRRGIAGGDVGDEALRPSRFSREKRRRCGFSGMGLGIQLREVFAV